MFTVTCITCEAKIRVNNESLVGQIVACPQCGSMVLLEPGNATSPPAPRDTPDAPAPAAEEPLIPPVVDFPHPSDGVPLTETTGSSPEALVPEPKISEKEARLRRAMLGVLGTLIALLLLVAGLFLFFGGETPGEVAEARNQGENAIHAPSGVDPAPPVRPVVKPSVETLPPADSTAPDVTDIGDVSAQAVDSAVVEETSARDPGSTTDRKTESTAAQDGMERMPPTSDTTPELPLGFRKLTRDVKSATGMEGGMETGESEPGRETAADVAETDQNRLLEMLKSRGDTNPLAVDAAGKLEFVVQDLRLEDTALLDVLHTLSRLADVPITVDWEAFREAGVSVEHPIRARLENQEVRSILKTVLEPLGLTVLVELGQVTVTANPKKMSRHRIPVDDLLPVLAEKMLPDLLTTLIPLPGGETTDGGDAQKPTDTQNPAGFSLEDGAVCFDGSRKTADQVLKLLEILRVLHGLPQRSPQQGGILAPEAFGWDTVQQTVTLNFFRAESLEMILTLLGKTHRRLNATADGAGDDERGEGGPGPLRILVDHRALHRNFMSLGRLRSTVHCDNGTLDGALENLLASTEGLPLDYRIVAENVLEASTPDDLASPEKMSVELHLLPQSVRRLTGAAKAERTGEFLQTLRTTLAPETWTDALPGPTFFVDEAAGAIFVRQSQPVQRQLRRMILEIDREEAGAGKDESNKRDPAEKTDGAASEKTIP